MQFQHMYVAEDYPSKLAEFAAPRTEKGLTMVRTIAKLVAVLHIVSTPFVNLVCATTATLHS